ncbi:OmpW/AlkL family protein [Allosphingosinicella sp.]|uniref:OmpW/AlkL family protein n=1 Tax=Allosphingosinicella sp. TaxID=2823234 RepID=UPI002FC1617E
MKWTMVLAGALAAPLAMAAAPAQAQEAGHDWFVRAGITQLTLADEIDLTVAGTPIPNAGIDTDSHYTPTFQLGRMLGNHVAVVLTVGLPPHIEIDGDDALEPFGRLAETTYGPAALMLQYRPIREGTFQPYVGAGACYMIIFSADDGAFRDVEIDDDLAPALEIGTDIMLTPRYGFFVEAKKAFLRTQARGTFAGAPVVGDVRLDPWAVSVGGVFRF